MHMSGATDKTIFWFHLITFHSSGQYDDSVLLNTGLGQPSDSSRGLHI